MNLRKDKIRYVSLSPLILVLGIRAVEIKSPCMAHCPCCKPQSHHNWESLMFSILSSILLCIFEWLEFLEILSQTEYIQPQWMCQIILSRVYNLNLFLC